MKKVANNNKVGRRHSHCVSIASNGCS